MSPKSENARVSFDKNLHDSHNFPDAVLFEPWGLGDALIAYAVALQEPGRFALACQSKWHPVLRAIASVQEMPCPELIGADLSYTGRHNHKQASAAAATPSSAASLQVLSIRGDVRDLKAARAYFPGATIRMRGWVAFAAKRSRAADWPFSIGLLPVLNRYEAWARLTKVPWKAVADFLTSRQPAPANPLFLIHAGAQWRSKQYPHVAALAELLRDHGKVQIAAGPGDPLPPEVSEEAVLRLANAEMVECMATATHVIANDSGPMHVAALLRRRTVCVANHSAMTEWLPPGVLLVGTNGHRGHRATEVKPSDRIFPDWATPSEVVDRLLSL